MERQPYTLAQDVLRTDVAGMPLEWVDYRTAAILYHTGQVAYDCGSPIYCIRGGYNARTGIRSSIQVNSIIATRGEMHIAERHSSGYVPPLNNRTL